MTFKGNSRQHYDKMREQLSKMFPSLKPDVESLGYGESRLTWKEDNLMYSYPLGRDFLIEALNQGGQFKNPIEFLRHHGIDIEAEMNEAKTQYLRWQNEMEQTRLR